MLFNSVQFLVFFPIVTLIYFVIPHRVRYIWLLIASYYFYMCWNAKYALLLAASTVITYLSGILIGEAHKAEEAEKHGKMNTVGKCKTYVAISFVLNIGVLVFYKYTNFIIDNLNAVSRLFHFEWNAPEFDIVLPVGISFFIFQALSYTMDVYRGNVRVEKNLLKYAVFVSFFPQLVAGPIERSSHLLYQFDEKHKFDFENMRRGLMMMGWGFFQKMVIADRVAVIVTQIFDYYTYYKGFEIAVGAVFFAIQIYCDFAGYSNIAIGAAQVMGFDLMKNFREPYLARSIADFWRRWHISLTSWFRDYLYFPLGGNRKGKWRKYLNVMIVFLVSGLWHGAMWTFVIWGGLNGLFQVIGSELKPLREKFFRLFHVKTESFSHKLSQVILTFLLVDVTWIFFRADTISNAFAMFHQMFSSFNPWIFFDGTLFTLGLSVIDFWITIAAIAVLAAVDVMHHKGIPIREKICKQGVLFRWALYYGVIFAILLFGIYGPGFDAAQFIYFQF